MTLDERLEALTHSVELLTSMHKDTEERIQKLADKVDRLTIRVKPLDEALIVTNAMVLRHETLVKEHAQWLQEMQLTLKTTTMLQQLTELKLQAFIDSLRRGGGNGHA